MNNVITLKQNHLPRAAAIFYSAKITVLTAEEEVKLDGRKIHLG